MEDGGNAMIPDATLAEWEKRGDKLPCGHPGFYMCGQGACGFCHEINERVEATLEWASKLAKGFERNDMDTHSEVCGCSEPDHEVGWTLQERIAAAIEGK